MEGKRLVGITVLVAIVATGWMVLVESASEASIRQLIRFSVDVAYPLFFLSFCASALYGLFPSEVTRYLLRNRRYTGLSFSALFLWHGALIYTLAQLHPEPFFSELTAATLYGGAPIFFAVAVMAATSNDASMARLGRKAWGRLHRVLGYLIAIMFLLTFLGKLDQIFFWPFAAMALAVFVLRVASSLLMRNTRNARRA